MILWATWLPQKDVGADHIGVRQFSISSCEQGSVHRVLFFVEACFVRWAMGLMQVHASAELRGFSMKHIWVCNSTVVVLVFFMRLSMYMSTFRDALVLHVCGNCGCKYSRLNMSPVIPECLHLQELLARFSNTGIDFYRCISFAFSGCWNLKPYLNITFSWTMDIVGSLSFCWRFSGAIGTSALPPCILLQ